MNQICIECNYKLYYTPKGKNSTSNFENNIFERDNHYERINFYARKTYITDTLIPIDKCPALLYFFIYFDLFCIF